MKNFFLVIILFYESFQKADIFFTKVISSSNMVKIFKKLNVNLPGKIGLKIHSGEKNGKFFLHPDFLQEIYDYTNGTFLETNTAYAASRHTTELHMQLLEENGWLKNGRRTVIMDEDPSADFNLSISDHVMISENIVGGRLKDFDSCIVLSHFKGHSMGGFGGALKQLSIGFASQRGKALIHTAGITSDWHKTFSYNTKQEDFTAAMGDAASSIVNYFKNKGDIVYINVMANISKSCDCSGARAPEPKIHDIGILASTDPVALDRACLDMIKKYEDIGTEDWLKQVENKVGENTIFIAEKHKIGSQEYNLIIIDEDENKGIENKDIGNGDKEDVENKKNKSEGSSNSFLFNILILLVFLIVIGVTWYICYKRKREQESEINIIIDQTDKKEY